LRQKALRKEAEQAATLDEAREEAAAGNEAGEDGTEEVLLKDEASEVEGRVEVADTEIEPREEDELGSEEESDRYATKSESGEGYVDELEIEFDAETREAEAREKEGLEPETLFDGQSAETEAREEDGSDADETFEDQAVEMDEVAKPNPSAAVPIPPPQTNEERKSDAIIP
jgi:hypothetical protein